jgi:hypothetical protein
VDGKGAAGRDHRPNVLVATNRTDEFSINLFIVVDII